MEVKKIVSKEELQQAFDIRVKVFVEEQQVPAEEEMDQYDHSTETTHFLAIEQNAPIGTCRLRLLNHGVTAKAERVAVSATARGTGVGKALMEALEEESRLQGAIKVVLGAQIQAIPFYERIGYQAFGKEFLDAGIPHRNMVKKL